MERDDQIRLLLEAGENPSSRSLARRGCCMSRWGTLQVKPDENLAMIADTIRYLKDQGRTVVCDAEHSFDGFIDEPEYAMATWQAAGKGGADVVCPVITQWRPASRGGGQDHRGRVWGA